jgi:hypothetical protein
LTQLPLGLQPPAVARSSSSLKYSGKNGMNSCLIGEPSVTIEMRPSRSAPPDEPASDAAAA